MNIILDTHIFLWVVSDPDRIDEKRRYELESMANTIYLSLISVAEMMIKACLSGWPLRPAPLCFLGLARTSVLGLALHRQGSPTQICIAESAAPGSRAPLARVGGLLGVKRIGMD